MCWLALADSGRCVSEPRSRGRACACRAQSVQRCGRTACRPSLVVRHVYVPNQNLADGPAWTGRSRRGRCTVAAGRTVVGGEAMVLVAGPELAAGVTVGGGALVLSGA